MVAQRPDRRLAAILAADVVGFSGLIERDEADTLARLASLRVDVIEPALAEHRGRLFKLVGDGMLAEFASVVDAVACAVDIQRRNVDGLSLTDRGQSRRHRGRWRRRLRRRGQRRRATGIDCRDRRGVVVSGTAWDQLHGKLPVSFREPGRAEAEEHRTTGSGLPAGRRSWGDGAAEIDACGGAAGPAFDWRSSPFDNLSGDPAQGYFSDGITEDLITELSRFRDLRVLARHSSFALRGQALDAGEIGRRLGVRFLLEGSVRRAGDRVRVTVQLIDAEGGGHLWADRYDRALDDIFAVQDEVVATIAATLAGRIQATGVDRARRKHTSDLVAYDCVLRGLERFADYGADANGEARSHFARAIALDPDYGLAHAFLALTHFADDWGNARAERLAHCLELASRAVALDPGESRCHRVLAMILLTAREFDRADHHSERSLALNPNDGDAAAYRAYVLCFLGRPDAAVPLIQRAIALNPYHPGWYWTALARALHGAGRHAEAVVAFGRIERPRFRSSCTTGRVPRSART